MERSETRTGSTGDPSNASRADTGARWVLALALVVGLLRFVRLGEWGLWIDEAFTFADAVHPRDATNPLGYRLWAEWLAALGHHPNELELRLPAAVFGWLCVPALFYAARPLVGARAGAVAALLLAASSWHLYWSQCARFYTLSMLLTLVGAGLALRGFERRRAVLVLLGLGVATVAATAHPSAALVLPGLVAAPLLARRGTPLRADGHVRHVTLAALIAALVVGGWWALGVLETWSQVKGRPNTAHLVLSSGFYVTPAIAAAALFGAYTAASDARARIALLISVLGWGAALVASTQMRTSAQYVFVLLPWAFVLAVAPLSTLRASREQLLGPAAKMAWVLVLVAPLLVTSFLYLTVRNGERPAWREAFSVVAEQRRAGDLVMGMAAPVGQYYIAPGSTDLRALGALDYLNQYTYDGVLDAVHAGRRTWFVVQHERLADWPNDGRRDELLRILHEDCRLVADFPLQVESRDLGVQVFLRE
jgi:hypothetical protein